MGANAIWSGQVQFDTPIEDVQKELASHFSLPLTCFRLLSGNTPVRDWQKVQDVFSPCEVGRMTIVVSAPDLSRLASNLSSDDGLRAFRYLINIGFFQNNDVIEEFNVACESLVAQCGDLSQSTLQHALVSLSKLAWEGSSEYQLRVVTVLRRMWGCLGFRRHDVLAAFLSMRFSADGAERAAREAAQDMEEEAEQEAKKATEHVVSLLAKHFS